MNIETWRGHKKTKSKNLGVQMDAAHNCVPEIWRNNSWYHEPLPVPVRQHRQYVIKIKSDEEEKAALFCVPASDSRSARVLAFALYGGFGGHEGEGPVTAHLEDVDIKTALEWTEVIQ